MKRLRCWLLKLITNADLNQAGVIGRVIHGSDGRDWCGLYVTNPAVTFNEGRLVFGVPLDAATCTSLSESMSQMADHLRIKENFSGSRQTSDAPGNSVPSPASGD